MLPFSVELWLDSQYVKRLLKRSEESVAFGIRVFTIMPRTTVEFSNLQVSNISYRGKGGSSV